MTRLVPELLRRRLPILDWGAEYSRQTLVGDLVAAAIVSIMLIPQSLAYALLVGVPPQVGLYASMAPLVLYALFGTSRALAVGPVAVASLMTAAAAGQVAAQGSPESETYAGNLHGTDLFQPGSPHYEAITQRVLRFLDELR